MPTVSLSSRLRDERGIALIMTLLLAFLVAALAIGAIMMSGNLSLVSRYHSREVALQESADAGLEIGRDSLNRNPGMLPASGDTVITLNAAVRDAQGNVIPGFTRSVYMGRSGGRTGGLGSAGQYGLNLASIVSVISDTRGAVAARRLLMTQESWSKFAVAVNTWPGGVMYGCFEQVQGPFFSNTNLILQGGCSGAGKVLFSGKVSVVGTITNPGSGNFQQGFINPGPSMPWPTSAAFGTMQTFAQQSDAVGGDYDLTPSMGTARVRDPSMRIEFVTVDVNGNGIIDWDEGFMRVWQARTTGLAPLPANNRAYVSARRVGFNPAGAGFTLANDPNAYSENCGLPVGLAGNLHFRSTRAIYDSVRAAGASVALASQIVRDSLRSPTKRCYLGGDPALFGGVGTVAIDTLTPDSAATDPAVLTPRVYGAGWWKSKRTAQSAAVIAKRPGDWQRLIPLTRNPNFKGVIYVNGSVAVSGRLRGRVSIVSQGTIMLADDLTYVTTPGTQCNDQGDILGLLSADSVLIEDNSIQRPFRSTVATIGGAQPWVVSGDLDSKSSENYHAFIFALKDWGGENWTPAEPLLAGEASPSASGGFVKVSGGLIQGFVRIATYGGSAGWQESHTYDVCGASAPPPYFPTTGRYNKNRYYELDPVWLNTMPMDTLFARLQSQ
ncbi:MAG: hypothetical protein ABI587_11300 [Gemmatimonadales bacterium]